MRAGILRRRRGGLSLEVTVTGCSGFFCCPRQGGFALDFPEGAVWPMRAPVPTGRERRASIVTWPTRSRVPERCVFARVPSSQSEPKPVASPFEPVGTPPRPFSSFHVDSEWTSAKYRRPEMKARVLVLPLLIVALFPLALADMEPIPGYETTKQTITAGSGPVVAKGDTVTVHATGIVEEGNKKFWSTKDPGQQPFTYQAGVGKVITGWDQGCLGMNVGETRKLRIPAHEGYGAGGFPAWGIPPGGTLLFEIEVLSIKGKGGEL